MSYTKEEAEILFSKVDQVLVNILNEFRQENFHLLKHPDKDEILNELDKFKVNDGYPFKQSPEEKALWERVFEIEINEKDYIKLATDKVIQKCSKLGYPIKYIDKYYYLFTGKCWSLCPIQKLMTFLKHVYIRMHVPEIQASDVNQQRKGLMFIKNKTQTTGNITENKSRLLLNFQNGTLEIGEDGSFELREHRSSDLITYVYPYKYVPSSYNPELQKYLQKNALKNNRLHILLEVIGSMVPDNLDSSDFLSIDEVERDIDLIHDSYMKKINDIHSSDNEEEKYE